MGRLKGVFRSTWQRLRLSASIMKQSRCIKSTNTSTYRRKCQAQGGSPPRGDRSAGSLAYLQATALAAHSSIWATEMLTSPDTFAYVCRSKYQIGSLGGIQQRLELVVKLLIWSQVTSTLDECEGGWLNSGNDRDVIWL